MSLFARVFARDISNSRSRAWFCLFTTLIVVVLVSASWGQERQFQRFLPGKRGELGSWLIAGPFAAHNPELEALKDYAVITAGGELPGTGGAVWKFFNSRKELLDFSSRINSELERNIFYLFTTVSVRRQQNGYIAAISFAKCVLFAKGRKAEPRQNSASRQYSSSLPLVFKPGRLPVLLRFEAVRGKTKLVVFVGAIKDKQAQYLRTSVIEVPMPKLPQALLNNEMKERVSLDFNPPLLAPGLLRARVRFLPGAPLPGKDIGIAPVLELGALRLKPGNVVANLTPAKLRRGVSYEFLVHYKCSYDSARVFLTIYAADTEFADFDKTIYSISSLQRQRKEASELLAVEQIRSGKPLALGSYYLLEMDESLETLEEPLSGRNNALESFLSSQQKLQQILDDYRQGKKTLSGKTGLLQGAYISDLDGSVQPYRLFIPEKNKRAGRRLPLAVLFHGYVPDYRRTDWMQISGDMTNALEEAGVALLLTFGRGNTDFLGVGEVDTFAALAQVCHLFPIDADRIYLLGFSMGGSGVWTTLTHYPGIFAAARIWSGRVDYYYWHGLDRRNILPYLRYLIDVDNPLGLTENLRTLPLTVTHPRKDYLVKVGHTELMAGLLRRQKGQASLQVNLPEEGTHWLFSKELSEAKTYKDLLAYVRPQQQATVEISTFTPKYGRNRWLGIEEISEWGKRAYLKASYSADKKRITIEKLLNVSVVKIFQEQLFAAGEGQAKKVKNLLLPAGWLYSQLKTGKNAGLLYKVYKTKKACSKQFIKLCKKPLLCGPVKEVFNQPFMLVKGTSGKAVERRHLDDLASRFMREWLKLAQGKARLKLDRELTTQDVANYNLVCLGTPRSNVFLQKVAKKLPFKFTEEGYGVGDVLIKAREGEKLGFVACYPNPEADKQMLVIISGLYYGSFLSFNHKWDLVPDYLVFNERRGQRDTNAARLAGFFNSFWQVDKQLQYLP